MRASNEQVNQIYQLALLGVSQEHTARVLGVSPSLMDEWIALDTNVSNARRRGGELANAQVAHALFKCATGYEYEDTYICNYRGEVYEHPIIKHKLPDPKAAELWLKNRQSELWHDRRLEDKRIDDYDNLTDEQLEQLVNDSFERKVLGE